MNKMNVYCAILLLMTRYVESLSTSNRMQKTEKRGHGMIWRFSTGFCNFSRYKILCCTAAPMQKNCSGIGGEYGFSMA